MKAQVVKMREAQGIGKKSGKPYNGYFVSFLFIDQNGELDCTNTFVDREACPQPLPADTMVDVVTTFGSSRIVKLDILPHEDPFMVRG